MFARASSLAWSKFFLHWNFLPFLCFFGAPLYLYASLFTSHNVPFLILNDQTVFWEYAFRMSHGDRVYQDFFQFTPPGTDLVYLLLLQLLGPHLWVVNFGLVLLGVGLFWLCFFVARRILSRNLALFASTIILVLLFGDWLDGTHHWFSLMLSLCAVRVVMPNRTILRLSFAGALTGVAAFFTQTAGLAAEIAILLALLWEHFGYNRSWRETVRKSASLVTSSVLLWLILSAYFLTSVGWRRLFYWQITYPRRYVDEGRGFIFPDVHGMLHLHALPHLLRQVFVYFLLAIYPPILWFCWRRRRRFDSADDMPIVLLALLGLMLMLEIITRVNWIRIYCVAPPALILFVWVIARCKSLSFQRLATIAATFALIVLIANQIGGGHHRRYEIAALPAGTVALDASECEEYAWIRDHTKPGDFFFESYMVDVYFPLNLRNPVFAEELVLGERTRPELVDLTVRQIEQKQVKYILRRPQEVGSGKAARQTSDNLGPFRSYLGSSYARVHVFSNQDEIWQRKGTSDSR